MSDIVEGDAGLIKGQNNRNKGGTNLSPLFFDFLHPLTKMSDIKIMTVLSRI